MNSDPAQPATGGLAGTRMRFRMPAWLVAFFLVASTFLAYLPAWHGLPIWDDWEHLTKARFASLSGLIRIWFEPGVRQRFDPLLDTAFWIQGKLWGGSTLGYHLVGIACHVAGALLVLAILSRWQVKGAWLAAAIFALHPVHVESVAWISELKNTMSGIFYLGAVLVYLKFDETRQRSWFTVAAGLFVCALLSKTTAVVWPLGMLVILWWKRGVLSLKRDVLPLLPLLVLAVLDGGVAMRVEREALDAASTELQFTLAQRFLIAGRACWFYLGKLLWPVELCPIYPRWQINQATGMDYLYPIGMLALLLMLWAVRKRSRAPLAALLYFIVTLSPLLGLIPFSYFRYSFVADHFQYLASLGIITLVVAGVVRIQETWQPFSGPVRIGLCLVLLMTLAGLTWRHSGAFVNLETFARTTLAQNPDCWAAHDFLGLVLTSQGKPAEAIDHFDRALEGNPRYALGHYNLGCVLALQGDFPAAIQQYEKALQLQPSLVRAHYNLGCALASQGRFPEAIQQYEQALQLNPDASNAPEVHNNLGIALASYGKLDEAIGHFQEAIRLRPAFADAHANLGHALSNQKRFGEAVEHYKQAVQLAPDSAGSCYELARLLIAREGGIVENSARAVQLAERACELTENRQPIYLDTLAAAYAAAHRFAEATATAEKALELARGAGQTNLAAEIQGHLELYQNVHSPETPSPAH